MALGANRKEGRFAPVVSGELGRLRRRGAGGAITITITITITIKIKIKIKWWEGDGGPIRNE